MMDRLLWVSNRLPVRLHVNEADGALTAAPSSGGLASALRDLRETAHAHWIGWPGAVAAARHDEARRVLGDMDATPLFLDDDEVRDYYEGFSNGVLWPVLHGNIDKLPLDVEQTWRTFSAVSRRFADACVARLLAHPETLWLHDFHLALVPSLVRERLLGARIGFFLHVPFPPIDVFSALPRWRDIVCGLLGADLLGFHTRSFLDAFKGAAARLGAVVHDDTVAFAGHRVELGVFPIGVDFDKIDAIARAPATAERAAAVRADVGERQILLGVDRLDYTKGIPRRLLAIEALLEQHPELAERICFLQLAVPTRDNVQAYAAFRPVVNELVGRINGKFGTPRGVPIHFMHREVPFDELIALYRAADVMVVTPIRDGMNLVCKEYVAARADERGALVLSEFAGAADELDGALVVNPFDIEDVARRLHEALSMPLDEQRARMTTMRRVVGTQTVHRWADTFVASLREATQRATDDALVGDLGRAARAPHLHVLLDYDGTLVPIAPTPAQAEPDEELVRLLDALARTPHTSVHIVSGRPADALEAWFGALDVTLHAEHGAHTKRAHAPWQLASSPAWLGDATRALADLAAAVPGAFVEAKRAGVALHTRALFPGERLDVERRAVALLESRFAPHVSVLRGDCVVEARAPHVHKGRVVRGLALGDDDVVVALGDDATDDELFAALPAGSVTIGVGARPLRARHRVATPLEARTILRGIAGARVAQRTNRPRTLSSAGEVVREGRGF